MGAVLKFLGYNLGIIGNGHDMTNNLRSLPSVDKVIGSDRLAQWRYVLPHSLLVDVTREVLEQERLSILNGRPCRPLADIAESVHVSIDRLVRPSLKPVINATGVILHTNLGRAPLSEEALDAMVRRAGGYCNLEFDLNTGVRGARDVHVEELLCKLTGAEAALVVNNNASAVLLALTALAKKKEVIVSRGQAVEIGGGFRIPDVMRQSGAKLVEVGTTNCTYIHDYEQAISPRTAALLRVHSSNFRIQGFSHSVTLQELVELGRKYDIPVFDDLGSGCILDVTAFGLFPEPMVQESVSLGVSLAFFSGDKLLGGPQSGIIVGKRAFVDKLRKHPLARALRIDKVRLAGLAVTLGHYLKGEALEKIPVWRMIAMPLSEIEKRAEGWVQSLGGLARVIEGESVVGGGSLPGAVLPTRTVAIGGKTKSSKNSEVASKVAQLLREYEPAIVGRLENDCLLLDPRTVLPEHDEIVVKALVDTVSRLKL